MSVAGKTAALRNAIAGDFAAAFAEDFREHGPEVIAALRAKDPAAYLRLAAAIEPTAADNEATQLAALSDEDLASYLEFLDRIRALAYDDSKRLGEVIEISVREGGPPKL